MVNPPNPLDTLAINAVRALAMDGVQAANSGHPGMPMGMAPTAYWLWTGYGLTLEDLSQFRQWGSKTSGHPE